MLVETVEISVAPQTHRPKALPHRLPSPWLLKLIVAFFCLENPGFALYSVSLLPSSLFLEANFATGPPLFQEASVLPVLVPSVAVLTRSAAVQSLLEDRRSMVPSRSVVDSELDSEAVL